MPILLFVLTCLQYADRRCRMFPFPDSKVHGAHMGPIWGRQDPGGPHVGPMKFAIGVRQGMSTAAKFRRGRVIKRPHVISKRILCTCVHASLREVLGFKPRKKKESSLSLFCFVHHVWIYHCVMRFQLWSRHMECDVFVTSLTSNNLTKCTQKTEESISQYEQWHHICMYLCNDGSDGHFYILRFTSFFIHGVQCIAPSAWLDCIVQYACMKANVCFHHHRL